MNFQTWLNQAWDKHGQDAIGVANDIDKSFEILENPEQIPMLSRLIVHIYGEHLQKISDGVAKLKSLSKLALAKDWSYACDIASLELQQGVRTTFLTLGASDQAKALAVAASAFANLNEFQKAYDHLKSSEKILIELSPQDPSHRNLAICANNLACSLEEIPEQNLEQQQMMIDSAKVARHFWELAGNWISVERAEYRLAKSFLKANQISESILHAEKCLQICNQNQAPALELFFAYEALKSAYDKSSNFSESQICKMKMEEHFKNLSAEDQSWCQASLA